MTLTAGGVGIAEPMPPSHEKKGVPYRHASRFKWLLDRGPPT